MDEAGWRGREPGVGGGVGGKELGQGQSWGEKRRGRVEGPELGALELEGGKLDQGWNAVRNCCGVTAVWSQSGFLYFLPASSWGIMW